MQNIYIFVAKQEANDEICEVYDRSHVPPIVCPLYSCNSTQLFRCSVPRCCSLLCLVKNMDIRTAREKRANGCQMSCGLFTSRHSSRNKLSRVSQSFGMGKGCAKIVRIKRTMYNFRTIIVDQLFALIDGICDDL